MPFYYYGAKGRLAGQYPPPTHGTIIEPFAGSAAYSMEYVNRQAVERVILIEKDPRVVETWRKLLAMSVEEVLSYPIPQAGERTEDFLIMTCAHSNAVAGCTYMTVTNRMAEQVAKMFRRIARVLEAAKEKVEITQGDYRDTPDIEGTWFIDPPYSLTGRGAEGNNRPQGLGYARGCRSDGIDFEALGEWCRSRMGQKIVCEYAGATWLPFRPLEGGGAFDSMSRSAGEVVWAEPEHQLSLV